MSRSFLKSEVLYYHLSWLVNSIELPDRQLFAK